MIKKLLVTAAAVGILSGPIQAADLSGMSWDEIVTQAKAEGEMTWYVWYLQDDLRRAVKAFEVEFGIDVTIPEGTAAGNAEKLLAERGRDAGDIDVFAWGYNDFDTINLAELFQPLDALPADDGRVGDLAGIEGQGYVLAYWGNQTGIAYDPGKVAADALPQDPDDFAAFWATNPGKFGFNYEKGGSGPSFYQNTLRVLSPDVDFRSAETSDEKLAGIQGGIDYFNTHADNYVVTASNADSIVRVSDGELWMVPAWEDHLAGLQNRGEVRKEIEFYIPEMGMNGGGNGVAIPQNAEHSAAAAVFVNWLTSAGTQTEFNKVFGTAPMHAEADDSAALVPNEQRAYRQPWALKPFQSDVEALFIDDVILER